MTIEGRPDIQVPNDYWQKEYETQRKDRMQDCSMITSKMKKYQADEHMKRCYLASKM